MLSSPFYTGQTTYGGAAARRGSLGTPAVTPRSQISVRPATPAPRDTLDMSHTARRILAALEEFSTPLNDARRIPTPAPPLAVKRRQLETTSESQAPKRPALSVPTVADLLKMRRLEQIQNSTTMARQVAAEVREPARSSGKIVTKTKERRKATVMHPLPPAPPELPKVPLQFSSLPKFDLHMEVGTVLLFTGC